MKKKKSGAKIGRPINTPRNEERLNLMAEIQAKSKTRISYSTAANRAAEIEAETREHPTDPSQFRKMWKKEEDAEWAARKPGPDGEELWSHHRADHALYKQLEIEGLTPTLVDGKLHWKAPKKT
jgi:hypothetical protein